MATTDRRSGNSRKNTGSRSSSGGSSATKRRTSSGSNSAKSKSRNTPSYDTMTIADYWHAFSKTKAFKPVMLILAIPALILIDLLISWNNYDRFFVILGIEILVVAVIWVIGLVFSISKDKEDAN